MKQANNRILILGAGMVVQPIVDYLLDQQLFVTLASRTVSKAEKALRNHPNGQAVSWTVDDVPALEKMISEHDLIVSLLPYTHHVTVARLCIDHKKNMLTTSYISDEMKALHQEAIDAGIIILNEIGVDPGFDHMTAMQIIDRIHEEGGEIEDFYSLCGALAAPEALDNPLNYKFSWSPKGVVMAGNNDARYLKDGQEAYKPTEDLFKDPLQIPFPEVGDMEVYPNRDSLSYKDLYGIQEAQTIYRGTFRYKNWCEAMDVFKAMGLTGYDSFDLSGMSYRAFVAQIAQLEEEQLEDQISEKYSIGKDSPALEALNFLGLLSYDPVHLDKGSPFDILSDLMIQRMMLRDKERDMVIMQHMFRIVDRDGKRKEITSRLLDLGDENYTSIAKTVAYPAAIGVKMILEGKINVKGVHLPISKDIYEPILEELAKLGIEMHEEEKEITAGELNT